MLLRPEILTLECEVVRNSALAVLACLISHSGWLELAMNILEATWKRCLHSGNCASTDTSECYLDHLERIMILSCTVPQFLLLFCIAWLKMLESLNVVGDH